MPRTLEQRVQALEDREEILKLKARYVNLNDGGWNGPTHTDPQGVADMFVEDGIWDGRPNSGYAEGRDQIKALFEAFGAVPFIVHYVTNPIIDVDGDAATGNWHALVTSTMPDQQAIWVLGIYKETYVRSPQGWKFKTLRFDTIASTPYEKGWAQQRHAYTESPFENRPVQ
ncbi:MAG: nuclear transport factor 2 family protein [Janthinobacterium lividum]